MDSTSLASLWGHGDVGSPRSNHSFSTSCLFFDFALGFFVGACLPTLRFQRLRFKRDADELCVMGSVFRRLYESDESLSEG